MIREWQVMYTGGNHCAAALLSFLIYWHDIRIQQAEKAREANDVAERHGETGTQDASLFQFHTAQQLRDGLLGLYSDTSIRAARKLLVKLGAITEHKNPNPRYSFDATTYFAVHSDVINAWLETYAARSDNFTASAIKNTGRDGENDGRAGVFSGPSGETEGTRTETTSGITTGTTKEILPARQPAAGSGVAVDLETALQSACRATWRAYSNAYAARHGAAPVRNAKVNANVKQLVQRLGHSEAPLVAEWFLSVNEAYVVRNMHDIGLLVAKAEAYRTQWATGRTMTETRARQVDKTQANLSAADEAVALLRHREAAHA